MKTKILIFLLCLTSLSVMGQIDKTQGTIRREKCSICGKVVSQCQYKGKHPKPQPEKVCTTCGKVLSRCKYKGKHPKPEERCNKCNKPIRLCSYNGKHPEREEAGYDVTFTCDVPSATLYIDENAYGNANGTCFLKTGSHGIKVTAYGYEDYSNSITVNRLNTAFSISLTKDPTTGTQNGHEWVDLGLSVKWATCNVGASCPSDYGGYYAWGETNTKYSYDRDNYFDCINPKFSLRDSSWDTYKIGGQTSISPLSGHDTARQNWGGTWRMPTNAENDELRERCKWTWASKNGNEGYIVTGPNGNSIFLPAAGYRYADETYYVGVYGVYWSNTLGSCSYEACYLDFRSGYPIVFFPARCYGQSVRPVTE